MATNNVSRVGVHGCIRDLRTWRTCTSCVSGMRMRCDATSLSSWKGIYTVQDEGFPVRLGQRHRRISSFIASSFETL